MLWVGWTQLRRLSLRLEPGVPLPSPEQQGKKIVVRDEACGEPREPRSKWYFAAEDDEHEILPLFFLRPLLEEIMNHAIRAAVLGPRPASPSTISISFFHSTPILERKRRTNWHSRFNYYAKRRRKIESKRTLLRNISEYAEYLFESWRDEDERNATNDGAPWFKRHYSARGTKKSGFRIHEPQWEDYKNKRRGAFVFCSTDDDDDEVETICRSAFGGARYSYWSFSGSENFQWRNSSSHAHSKSSQNWSYESDDETDTSPESGLASERLALGLNASGPLKLEEVKNAYRACALRWHPDRHRGASKVAAEEKFKHCSAAYKILCDRLAVS